jgi:hypothetical protein
VWMQHFLPVFKEKISSIIIKPVFAGDTCSPRCS